MNFRFKVLEMTLNRAASRWKWLRFVQYSCLLGICLALAVLFLETTILLGWLTNRSVAVACVAILAAVGLVAWLLVAIGVLASTPERPWLAAAMERVDRRFLDRLNTLLFLQSRSTLRGAHSFAIRIARQTQAVLAERRPPPPFPARPVLSWLTWLAVTVLAVLALNQLGAPWQRLQLAQAQKPPVDAQPPALELPPPATNQVEQSLAWGEVRITDPGMDLRVTKVDVVPLQIEAAANERLEQIDWFTAINGSAENVHPLPPPAEPRYAIYRPDLYLDELNLSDWDVITYYARAVTEQTNSHASEVFFLEVRPFREDIAKLPGGEGGCAYKYLNELSGLIARQQHVLRQTHQHLQNPPPQERLRLQDRQKLGDAEIDLAGATKHLYAEMATEMENKPIGEALDNLAKAEKSLGAAGKQLHDNALAEAPKTERAALSELVAARKMFQKAVTDNPEAFKEDQPEEEPLPVASSARQLSQMAEFRNEAKAAQDLLQKTLEQQRQIEQQTRTAPLSQYPRLAEQERKLHENLKNFAEQHPVPFKGSEVEAQASEQALESAAKSLETRRSAEARNATQDARQRLEKLADSMREETAGQQLADAYRLKRLLDHQVQKLGQCSQPGSAVSDAELQQTGREARETVDQLRKAAEQEPTRDAFGQPLRDALSGENKVDLDAKLRRLQLPLDEPAKQQAAGEAGKTLAKVSDAFTASQPDALKMARQKDSLKPGDQDSFALGMAELESLIKQLLKDRELSKEDQARQGRQALLDLQNGMRSQFGDNEQGSLILRQLEQALKAERGLEPGDLRRIADALQHFSAEVHQELARKQDEPRVTNIDPASLPPAYRGRIQKYFEKLSERQGK